MTDSDYERTAEDIRRVAEALRKNIKKKFGEPDDQEGEQEEDDS